MNSKNLQDIISDMDVVDTHNHLVHDNLTASDFWEIAEYFWLARHLWAAGYSQKSGKLDEKTRVGEFCKAYGKTVVVKKVLTEFLEEQINLGWIDEEIAVKTARCWLCDAPLKLIG